ncbi:basic leucine zipper transcriptional factor ATF-like 3 isoform X2 [Brienomyrus brachyistius]|uniref:basic leucine zipper transcriptional factor ATF-like 3 isoform X2 n=1 Tax=Brienomyrus brachyistius TaxID=42636 RepID=UPI0020B23CE1|nr:basic leucine zipper transcriptional factor ATF-like 3 isoform X2 [Brienomyrus brachyistius]
MSAAGLSGAFLHRSADLHMLPRSEDDDDGRRQKRREKNRAAAQRSRKKQTQRADRLHEEYKCLEQENLSLMKEVQTLSEEQRRLTEALKAHEPLCLIMHCSAGLMSHARLELLAGGLPR